MSVTYDIYPSFIYGGDDEDGEARNTLSDIHVLSIPAFQWFEIEPETQNTRRTYHDCASAGNSQMIVVGGIDRTANDGHYWGGTDEWKQGLGIFDMHELKWRDSYDPEAPPYEAPAVVREWYEKGYGVPPPSCCRSKLISYFRGMDTVGWDGDDIEHMFADFKLSSAEEESRTRSRQGPLLAGLSQE